MLIEAGAAVAICLLVSSLSKRGLQGHLRCANGLHEYEVELDEGHTAHAKCVSCGKRCKAVA